MKISITIIAYRIMQYDESVEIMDKDIREKIREDERKIWEKFLGKE